MSSPAAADASACPRGGRHRAGADAAAGAGSRSRCRRCSTGRPGAGPVARRTPGRRRRCTGSGSPSWWVPGTAPHRWSSRSWAWAWFPRFAAVRVVGPAAGGVVRRWRWRGCSRWRSSTAPRGSRGCSTTPRSTCRARARSTTSRRCCAPTSTGSPTATPTTGPPRPPGTRRWRCCSSSGWSGSGWAGSFAAGLVVTVIGATTVVSVLALLRTLDAERLARRAAPFLVLSPAAVFMAVSADAVFAAVPAAGLALLARAAVEHRSRLARAGRWPPGLVLGSGVLLSYGMGLMGLVALAVLAGRPVVAPAAGGGRRRARAGAGDGRAPASPGGRPTRCSTERYWDGIAGDRPAWYWMWGNLAALAVSAGPLVGAGAGARRRACPAAAGRRAGRPARGWWRCSCWARCWPSWSPTCRG